MDARIHQVLDGELPREALDPAEARALAAAEASIAEAIRLVPSDIAPEAAPAVLSRLDRRGAPGATDQPFPPAAPPARGWRLAAGWLWRPRPVVVAWRPAYALAVLILASLAGAAVVGGGRATPPVAETGQPPRVLVQFRLDAPAARAVSLAGDFTSWQPIYVLRRSESGVWTVVAPLEPGVHDYAFVVDEEHWVPDPMAPPVADGFGGLNSRIAVMTPDPARPL